MIGSDFSCAVWSRALGCDFICIYSVDYLIIFFQASISYFVLFVNSLLSPCKDRYTFTTASFFKIIWLPLTSIFVNTIQHNETQ